MSLIATLFQMPTNHHSICCHSRESGNPTLVDEKWIPAFAGMTGLGCVR
jgi:hypothetical protein